MHMLGEFNTISTYTAQRGIYILVKKSLGNLENIEVLDNSTMIFDMLQSTHRQIQTINFTSKKLIIKYKIGQKHLISK